MKTEVEKQRAEISDLAEYYLTGHDTFTDAEKQKMFEDLQHQQRRLAKLKNSKDRNDDT